MAKEYGIGMVYQELSLARRISIYENLLVGRLPKKNALFIDKKRAIVEAGSCSPGGLGDLDPTIDVSEISQCDAQLVEIARFWVPIPRSSSWTSRLPPLQRGSQAPFHHSKSQGPGVGHCLHLPPLAEIFEIADTVTVMRDGRAVGTMPVADVDTEAWLR